MKIAFFAVRPGWFASFNSVYSNAFCYTVSLQDYYILFLSSSYRFSSFSAARRSFSNERQREKWSTISDCVASNHKRAMRGAQSVLATLNRRDAMRCRRMRSLSSSPLSSTVHLFLFTTFSRFFFFGCTSSCRNEKRKSEMQTLSRYNGNNGIRSLADIQRAAHTENEWVAWNSAKQNGWKSKKKSQIHERMRDKGWTKKGIVQIEIWFIFLLCSFLLSSRFSLLGMDALSSLFAFRAHLKYCSCSCSHILDKIVCAISRYNDNSFSLSE